MELSVAAASLIKQIYQRRYEGSILHGISAFFVGGGKEYCRKYDIYSHDADSFHSYIKVAYLREHKTDLLGVGKLCYFGNGLVKE